MFCKISISFVPFIVLFMMSFNKSQNSTEGLEIIERKYWHAQHPNGNVPNISSKYADRVIIIHTVSGWCFNLNRCIANVQAVQRYHMITKDFVDIAYNFLIGGDGRIYEGIGWGKKGSHTKNYNDNSVGIAFIGTFSTVEPTKSQLKAAELLINYGVQLEKISPAYRLYGHCQLINTESPGKILYEIIKGWDHWSEIVDNYSD